MRPKPADIFCILLKNVMNPMIQRLIEPCIAYTSASHVTKIHILSPEINVFNQKQGHSNAYID